MSIIGRLYKIARSSLPSRRAGGKVTIDQPGTDRTWPEMKDVHEQNVKMHLDLQLVAYYANLEIPYGSDLVAARKAWRTLLKKYHPDLHSNDPEKRRIAHELTQGLNKAFEELEKRLS